MHRHTMIAVSIALLAAPALAEVKFDVKATVKDMGNKKIGSLAADGGFNGDKSGMNGRFNFEKDFAFLDDHYDFDWVNICTAEKGDSGLFKKKPAFDPQPDPIVKGEDKIPFYYNAKEWGDNKFSGEPIYKSGEFSQFIDFPKLPKDQGFSFSCFLVLRDNGGKYSLNGKLEMCVLAGWTWNYDGDDKFNPPDTNGVSTALSQITIDAAAIKLFTDSVANNADFAGWTASSGRTLVPTPATAALLGLAGLVAARRRRA